MADVAEAIAAAIAAAAPPTSPHIKTEPLVGDAMVLDHSPQPPQSPLKRPRTPDQDDDQARDEKRPKIESEVVNEMDEIALLVQQAQAEAMQHFQSEPDKVDDPPSNDADHFHDISNGLSNNINHDIHHDISGLDTEFEQRAPSPVDDPEPRPESLWSNPRDFTRRKHIIPALGSLAVDIITAWSEQSLEDTIATLSGDSDSDIAKEYVLLKSAFDVQRKQLSDTYPLLYPEHLNVTSQTREVIRIVNLATTCASVFGTNELGLEEVNEHFLRIFVPENHEIPRDAAELYMGLKTQIFLAVLESEQEKARDQFLDDLFVTRLESSLQEHHPSLPLTATEYEFIANAKARRAMLLNESTDMDSIQALSKQFTYEAFLDSLSTFLNDHIESIRIQGTGRVETTTPIEDIAQDEHVGQTLDEAFDINAMIAEASRAAQSALETTGEESHELDDLSAFLAENVSKAVEQAKESATSTELPSAIASAAESASRATMLALQSIQQNQYHPTTLPQAPGRFSNTDSERNVCSPDVAQASSAQPPNQNNYQVQQTQQTQQTQPQQQYYHYQQHHATNGMPSYQTVNDHLPPNQSDSTPALYERARQAAAARSSTHARREGSHSTRRPWSPEEEKALMMGLDMVKGPHWSQILSLFGPNGSISNILADRTQVQLKDKARNLKLFFLKTNSEMPYYLQCVTGELKTRAPTQAARKEAEEKARLNSEEQQAHVNGILTLAGGLQNNAPSIHSPSAGVPRSATPNQPLSHPGSHPGSQPGTPRMPHQSAQQSAPTPSSLPRPVIPAPQPVSLPTFTSTSHLHTQPHISQAERHTTSMTNTLTPPVMVPTTTQATATVSPPITAPAATTALQNNEPEKNELSSVDAAVLGLRAALERERERERESDALAAVAATAYSDEGTMPSTNSATSAATSTE
ncbi:telomere repeat binding factor-domain-containing protein [Daldinia vernicosa]|uniref:telomere repeat binding factor-domain-containing protein n=1 Tax=Daldinia vernicosa TaxID=114800 RepID=UPI002008420C|nr:telomere repeat binding factor-domain-containing protein [Daldinia vernicosa]KAI0853900.1 telomere repeat binding factor-domain-containing protein [Daldinia vernicosa]